MEDEKLLGNQDRVVFNRYVPSYLEGRRTRSFSGSEEEGFVSRKKLR